MCGIHVCVGWLCGLRATAFPFCHRVGVITDYAVSFLPLGELHILRSQRASEDLHLTVFHRDPLSRDLDECADIRALCELTTGTLSSLENDCAALIPVKQKHIQSFIKPHILLLLIPDESELFETNIFQVSLKGKCVCTSTKHNCKNNRIHVFRRKSCSCTTCHHYAMCFYVVNKLVLTVMGLLRCSCWLLGHC